MHCSPPVCCICSPAGKIVLRLQSTDSKEPRTAAAAAAALADWTETGQETSLLLLQVTPALCGATAADQTAYLAELLPHPHYKRLSMTPNRAGRSYEGCAKHAWVGCHCTVAVQLLSCCLLGFGADRTELIPVKHRNMCFEDVGMLLGASEMVS